MSAAIGPRWRLTERREVQFEGTPDERLVIVERQLLAWDGEGWRDVGDALAALRRVEALAEQFDDQPEGSADHRDLAVRGMILRALRGDS